MTENIIQEHNQREKDVIDFLTTASEEINYSISKQPNGDPLLPHRARLSLIFTLIDILGLYWDKYCGLNNTQSIYFKNWVSFFCLTQENAVYDKNKFIKQFNCEDFYKLRCSILHFYGIPRTSEGIQYILLPDFNIIQKMNFKSTPEAFVDVLSSSIKAEHRIVQIELFKQLVWTGSISMINKMKQYLKAQPQQHIDGIKRIHEEVKDRGVSKINMEEGNISK
ncbi:MAG: hypothetical protein COU29_00185 [Candidatus Magasanikbacteria bacterium CG10_big_fil_rev_8_21_14_0_10_36_32]|uniref:Uncharacterized protein n=1 Tax=Candidatus Magasanikbacteria bacterium CG10_big_fil_rev_8_21_14_0_10_36_32 TaxID=1974646 RepID=A0A2M6W7P8_9BACT|nr:MAG: hypothetical protein COU29_00185 [Candidatus Magasanikbacteria bacterium CG10_big_fil_rev_8_21_14_0_10_36_32]